MATEKDTSQNTVYISNLSYERDRNGIKSLISKFGDIKNIKIIVEPSTNQSRGMAFVEMATAAQAKKVIEALNQTVVDGRTIKAKYATPLKPTSISIKSKEKKEAKDVMKEQKDLTYKARQLAKKARNDAKRSGNPFLAGKALTNKKVAKKVTKKVSKK